MIWNLIILLAFCCIVPFDSINSNSPNQLILVVQSVKGGGTDNNYKEKPAFVILSQVDKNMKQNAKPRSNSAYVPKLKNDPSVSSDIVTKSDLDAKNNSVSSKINSISSYSNKGLP